MEKEGFFYRPIAHIDNDYVAKFGIPRQSGLVPKLLSKIIFTPQYRSSEALRGLEGYSHVWLIWHFDLPESKEWSPTVRPPRLKGNTRMGVFATRSPFRPNPLGLSLVKLEKIELNTKEGPVLTVSGADLMKGTAILDIKPYLPYVEALPLATGGFGAEVKDYALGVDFPQELLTKVDFSQREVLLSILAQDPRPSYQNDPTREYGLSFANLNIKFKVEDGVLTVLTVDSYA